MHLNSDPDALAISGNAPKFMGYTTKRGLPLFAVIASGSFGLLGQLQASCSVGLENKLNYQHIWPLVLELVVFLAGSLIWQVPPTLLTVLKTLVKTVNRLPLLG